MPESIPHVALLIETSRSYSRGLLSGIRTYVAEHGPWSIFMESRALDSAAPPWLKNWQGHGILTRTGSQSVANQIRATGLPAVELRATRLRHDFPFVGVDNSTVGSLIAEHFMDRGYRHFGCYALRSESFFEQRCDNFIETLSEHGFDCAVYEARGQQERPSRWEQEQTRLSRWIEKLSKPVGLMACTDQMGFWMLDACKRSGFSIPEDVAVVGVENDESLCEMSTPPLSSLAFRSQTIGYHAARLLDDLIHGRGRAPAETLFPPGDVVTRQSSDGIALDDRRMADALRFIRTEAFGSIDVSTVARAVGLSRSSLERRMREAIGRSPKAEIQRVRFKRVTELLIDTDLTLADIAERVGFEHP
ncbi:MAG: DNA-binding transcriptional regulator, partial [Verrucomicrobiota bacterium]